MASATAGAPRCSTRPPIPTNTHGKNGSLDLLWNVLDLTPEGRGGEWGPKLSYP
jgi:hypothetical protein